MEVVPNESTYTHLNEFQSMKRSGTEMEERIPGGKKWKKMEMEFISFGRRGDPPLFRGYDKSTEVPHEIPDGLVGEHRLYGGNWRVEIHHRPGRRVLWVTEDLIRGKRYEYLESDRERDDRNFYGRTVCNEIVRRALGGRGVLEVKERLLPKRITIGLVWFGFQQPEFLGYLRTLKSPDSSHGGMVKLYGEMEEPEEEWSEVIRGISEDCGDDIPSLDDLFFIM